MTLAAMLAHVNWFPGPSALLMASAVRTARFVKVHMITHFNMHG